MKFVSKVLYCKEWDKSLFKVLSDSMLHPHALQSTCSKA